jgi:hypothetical protein
MEWKDGWLLCRSFELVFCFFRMVHGVGIGTDSIAWHGMGAVWTALLLD